MIGFYAGSFDPFTNGHLEIVKKGAKYFKEIIIGIGCNSEKNLRINKTEMKKAIEETIIEENLENVRVVLYNGLTVEEAKKQNADILIRGLRNGTDYQYEENVAEVNETCFEMDTCYLRAGKLGFLSSSTVMELYNNGKSIKEYVPKAVAKILQQSAIK